MGNAQGRPSETIDRERKRLVETLQADSGLLLDALLARGVLTGPEYEALDALPDAERRVRRLLLLVQSKGEAACHELLNCAQRTVRAPDPAWDWQHATGNEVMTLHAQGTGLPRQLAQGPHAPGCLELQIATPRVPRTLRQHSLEPLKNLSHSWKLRPLKRLSRSWNPKWIQNQRQRQRQNQSLNWSQSLTSRRRRRRRRRRRSLKIPEGHSTNRPLHALAGQ
uniref:Nucleolar protein 3 n=1 Tax=Catagonus wagneri TaxID=51154 RepID=A0A8C3YQS7_9CETA